MDILSPLYWALIPLSEITTSVFTERMVGALQEDCGVDFSGRIKPKRDRVSVKYKKGFEADLQI